MGDRKICLDLVAGDNWLLTLWEDGLPVSSLTLKRREKWGIWDNGVLVEDTVHFLTCLSLAYDMLMKE